MKEFQVKGMTCAACVNRVEKAVKSVDGVTSCNVSLLTNSMVVDGSANSQEIIKAVSDAGYQASLPETKENLKDEEDDVNKQETQDYKNRLLQSLILLIPLMYLSMGHSMLHLPVPYFDQNMLALSIFQMMLAGVIIVINWHFFHHGFSSLWKKSPTMDTLVALGSFVSYVYSFALVIGMTMGYDVMHLYHGLYFEASAMILVFITVGKILESISKGRTTSALKGLIALSSKQITLLKDGKEVEVDIEQAKLNDVFVVKPGEKVPLDGKIIHGFSAVDESSFTGESVPVDKAENDTINAGTINLSGYLQAIVIRENKDTLLQQMITMVKQAALTKAPIAKIADTVSGIFVPFVLVLSLVTFVVWMLVGQTFAFALARAITVLVISCPCALGLATPVAIMVGNGVGAKQGILFKTSAILEETGKSKIIVFDKTGTITKGKFVVENMFTTINEQTFKNMLYHLESHSQHPLAKAIVEYTSDVSTAVETKDFVMHNGSGVELNYQGAHIYGGNQRFIEQYAEIDQTILQQTNDFAKQGKTVLFFAKEKEFIGYVALKDELKEDAKQVVQNLNTIGLQTVMLTGDKKETALAIGQEVGIQTVISQVLPTQKQDVVKKLQSYGKVIMVGDGVNDALALTQADIGIAIGDGSDVAIDAADIVLVKNNLKDIVTAILLSRKTLLNIKENLFWAFFYNLICIPVAMGIFGLKLNPMYGALAMSLSSVTVVTNALRLNLFQPVLKYKRNDIEIKEFEMEEKHMKKQIMIDGMSCSHCENAVRKALEKVTGVTVEKVSATDKCAVVSLEGEVNDASLKKAVEDADYDVVEVKAL